jgi:isopenicillin N synthase-like dioxygenase
MEKAFHQFEQITFDLLEALEIGMNLTPGSFTSKCVRSSSEFRMIHYPPITVEDTQGGLISRAWPHYDIGVISLLFQDSVGGLEIDDGRGGFASATPEKPTDLIVNAAETIQRWSNGHLKAGLHRVTIPPSIKCGEEGRLPQRRSVVYFCKANRNASVAPLPELIKRDHIARYDDLTFLAYHQKRVQSAYA